MAIRTIVECDFCGKEKTSVNHWFWIEREASKFCIYPFLEKGSHAAKGLSLACSESEINSALSEWLGQRKEKGLEAK